MHTAGLRALSNHLREAQSTQVPLETFSVWCHFHATVLKKDHLPVLNKKPHFKDWPAVFHVKSGSHLLFLTLHHPVPLQLLLDLTCWNIFLQCHDPTFLRIRAGLFWELLAGLWRRRADAVKSNGRGKENEQNHVWKQHWDKACPPLQRCGSSQWHGVLLLQITRPIYMVGEEEFKIPILGINSRSSSIISQCGTGAFRFSSNVIFWSLHWAWRNDVSSPVDIIHFETYLSRKMSKWRRGEQSRNQGCCVLIVFNFFLMYFIYCYFSLFFS